MFLKILSLGKKVPLVLRLLLDGRVALGKKLLFIGAGIFYWLLPLDLFPDFIPFAGQLDDLGVTLFLLNRFIAWIPPEILGDYQKGKGGGLG